MANNGQDITTRYNLDISGFRNGINEANRAIRLANAEFRNSTASMDNWADSTEGVRAKLRELSSVLQAENNKLDNYREQQRRINEAYQENTRRADALRATLQNLANNGVSTTSQEYRRYQQALNSVETEQERNRRAASDMEVTILNQQATIRNTEREINNYNNRLSQLQSQNTQSSRAIDTLTSDIRQQENELNRLRDAYANVVLTQGQNSNEARQLASRISSLNTDLNNNRTRLNDARNAAQDLTTSLNNSGNASNQASQGFTVMKGALASLVADGIRKAITSVQDFIKESINVGKEFEKSMSKVQALSGATDDELKLLKDTAKEYGSTTQFSATQAADALGYMALAGWDAKTSASALGGVLDLAAASGMDLAEASDMVTDYMSAFSMEAEKSSYFADLLAYSQAHSNTSATQLGEAFKNCAANMNAAGQDIETTTSFLAMMANQGLKGSEAGTALTAVMRDMTAKMKDGKIAIGDTSVAVMDANGNYRDLTDILLDVEKSVDGMGDAEKATALQSTFTADSIKGLNLMLNAGVSEASKFEDELRNSSGAATEMATVMNDNLNGDLTSLGSKFEGIQIAMYEKFEPALRAGTEILSKLLDGLNFVVEHANEFVAGITAMAVGIGAYVAYTTALTIMTNGWKSLAIVQKVVTAGQWLMNAAMSANPIGLVIAAIAALVAGFIYLWNTSENFRNFWINLWNSIVETVTNIVNAITETVSDWINNIKEFFSNLIENIQTAWSNFWDNLFNLVQTVISSIVDTISNWINNVIQFFTKLITTIITSWNIFWINLFNKVFEIVNSIKETIFTWMSNIIQFFIDFITNIVTRWTEFWSNLFDKVKEIVEKIKENISSKFKAIKDFLTNIWENIKNTVQKKWDEIKQRITNAIQGIKDNISAKLDLIKQTWNSIWEGIKQTTENIWNGIWNVIRNVINSILGGIEGFANGAVRGINKVIDALNGLKFTVPDWVPGFGGETFGFNIRKISEISLPRLAEGGVLKKGQLGLLEGSGAEAVVPLERNKYWIKQVANELRNELYGDASSFVNGINGSNISNNTNFTQIINAPKSPSRIEVYRDTKRLLALRGGK